MKPRLFATIEGIDPEHEKAGRADRIISALLRQSGEGILSTDNYYDYSPIVERVREDVSKLQINVWPDQRGLPEKTFNRSKLEEKLRESFGEQVKVILQPELQYAEKTE